MGTSAPFRAQLLFLLTRSQDAEEKHHVIKMTEHFYFRGHLCIAMELLSINLYELIKANNFHGFTTALIRRFTSQMLQSLLLMRQHRIVHCDLKPEVCSSVHIGAPLIVGVMSRTSFFAIPPRAPSRLSTSVAAVSNTRKVRPAVTALTPHGPQC